MYIVAIDQGTTSCRAIVFDDKMQVVSMAQEEFTQFFPHPGWVEHDPNEIWATQERVFLNALKDKNILPSEVKTIGITNQRETTVVWNRQTGQPIYPAIVWQDRRTHQFCEKLKKEHDPNMITAKTGLRVDAYFSGTKVRWILDHVNGAKELAEKGELAFGTIDSWLIWKMTGGKQHVTDPTNASRTMLYNIHEQKWDEELLEVLGVPSAILPNVLDNDSVFGYYDIQGSLIPVSAVLGDQQAALFGQMCLEKGDVKNTYGTGCFMLMNTGPTAITSTHNLLTTIAWSRNGECCYALEGSVFIAGAAIQWLRDGLQILDSAADSEEMAEAARADSGVVFVPAFVGLGAPYWNMGARGAILGITRDTSRNDIVKAALQSLAFQTKDVLEAMQKDAGINLTRLRVDGGAVRNNYLLQFQSDILRIPVDRPSFIESTALGAALMAGWNEAIWTKEEVLRMKAMDRSFNTQMPMEEADFHYKRWQDAVQRCLDWEKTGNK